MRRARKIVPFLYLVATNILDKYRIYYKVKDNEVDNDSNQRKYKSILQEINKYVPASSKEDVIDSRGQHIISSAINLIQLIRETYTPEEAEQLERRFMSSIKGNDSKRFTRSLTKIRESRND